MIRKDPGQCTRPRKPARPLAARPAQLRPWPLAARPAQLRPWPLAARLAQLRPWPLAARPADAIEM
jgi:hypothetical protein